MQHLIDKLKKVKDDDAFKGVLTYDYPNEINEVIQELEAIERKGKLFDLADVGKLRVLLIAFTDYWRTNQGLRIKPGNIEGCIDGFLSN
jgi:hypothetical protein